MTSSASSGNDRGQFSQVFLFFMAVVIIVATIYLGIRLIGGLTATACDASDVEFQDNLRKLLDGHSVYGSRATVEIRAPCDTKRLCFVDAVEIGNANFDSEYAAIRTAIRQGVKRNIFLVRERGVMDIGYDERIIVEREPGDPPGGELCLDLGQGRFTFRAEGFGRFIRVSG